jgi:2-polyprenyl-6-methoxyphenol hydroxylase-like FAD-dependent oxidoreductase
MEALGFWTREPLPVPLDAHLTGEVEVVKDVNTARAALTLVADGLWSGLRREVDPVTKPQQISTFVALILQHPPMESPVPTRGYGHVVLADPCPVLLYQISSTETRVLVRGRGRVMMMIKMTMMMMGIEVGRGSLCFFGIEVGRGL